jgi:hypothetical protein
MEKKNGATSVDEYIAMFPPEVQKKLQEVRAAIHTAAPEATEKISYQMPTFYLDGNLVYFGAVQIQARQGLGPVSTGPAHAAGPDPPDRALPGGGEQEEGGCKEKEIVYPDPKVLNPLCYAAGCARRPFGSGKTLILPASPTPAQ